MSKGNGEVQTGWGSRKQLTVHNAAFPAEEMRVDSSGERVWLTATSKCDVRERSEEVVERRRRGLAVMANATTSSRAKHRYNYRWRKGGDGCMLLRTSLWPVQEACSSR